LRLSRNHLRLSRSHLRLSKSLLRNTIKPIAAARLHRVAVKQQVNNNQGTRVIGRDDNKPIELWSNKVIEEKLNYIHNNPVEEGLVFRAEHYVYSSATDYAGEKE